MAIIMPLSGFLGVDEPSQDEIDSTNEAVTNVMKDVRVFCAKLADGLPPDPPPPPPPGPGTL